MRHTGASTYYITKNGTHLCVGKTRSSACIRLFRLIIFNNVHVNFSIIAPGERALNSKGYNITKINTTSIQYVERIFERRRGFRISREKLLILKKGPGPRNA